MKQNKLFYVTNNNNNKYISDDFAVELDSICRLYNLTYNPNHVCIKCNTEYVIININIVDGSIGMLCSCVLCGYYIKGNSWNYNASDINQMRHYILGFNCRTSKNLYILYDVYKL